MGTVARSELLEYDGVHDDPTSDVPTDNLTLFVCKVRFPLHFRWWMPKETKLRPHRVSSCLTVSISANFITAFNSGDVLKFQQTGSSLSDRLVSNTGQGTTRPSFSCTIIRLQ